MIPLADGSRESLERLLQLYGDTGHQTRLHWLLERLRGIDRRDNWDRIASESLYLELLTTQRALVERFLVHEPGPDAFAEFLANRKGALQRIEEVAQEIESDPHSGLAAYSVLSQQIRRLC